MNVTELDIEVFNYSELRELRGRIEARMHDMQEIGVPALVGPGSHDSGEADCCSSAAAGPHSRAALLSVLSRLS